MATKSDNGANPGIMTKSNNNNKIWEWGQNRIIAPKFENRDEIVK